MSKRIIFCADGTWDNAASHTNVYKLYKSMTVGAGQMPFYDDGVGASENPIIKLVGGAFGAGLFGKIKEAYTKIAQVYEAGDQVFLFGFSRGAYTARSLAGMIAISGLPTQNFTDGLVDIAFRAYREKDNRASLLAQLKDASMFDAKMTMVGVWETVGALGIPSVFGAVDPLLYGFLDTSLHPDVLNAYQAVAIDEKRAQFPPTLWDTNTQPGQTLEQVWFSGVHSDVGGGEPVDGSETTALSDITLGWIMNKASALGIGFDDAAFKQYTMPLAAEYALDKLHTSWTVINGFPKERTISPAAVIGNSVTFRWEQDQTYRPKNLASKAGNLSNQYGLEPVVTVPQAAVAAGS